MLAVRPWRRQDAGAGRDGVPLPWDLRLCLGHTQVASLLAKASATGNQEAGMDSTAPAGTTPQLSAMTKRRPAWLSW